MFYTDKENGFIEERQNGSHKFLVHPVNGKRTTVPYHSKDLKKGTKQQILKDPGLK